MYPQELGSPQVLLRCEFDAAKGHHKATPFLDLGLTLSTRKKMASVPNENFSFALHWESAITGCTLTADRLAASGLVDNPMRRFCHSGKNPFSILWMNVPLCRWTYNSHPRVIPLGRILTC